MADATITKRLIVSGLTPAITVDDINRRLGLFGSVKAMDGFGLEDGLGQPRKFGFVTLETTPSGLGKCMNVLSGSVWKGTKLRLGEAKPDYKERIAQENQQAEEPLKKRRRFDAVLAEDMSLVTAENVDQRPGWILSPLGRITHPLKIRPLRPVTDQITKPKSKLKESLSQKRLDKSKKKKVKKPDTRARRRTIDMTKCGSTLLKGNFLDSVLLPVSKTKSVDDVGLKDSDTDDDAASSTTFDVETTALRVEELPTKSQVQAESSQLDMESEKAQTLDFLTSLFGGKGDEDDWIGRESVASDVEMGEFAQEDNLLTGDVVSFEEVPRTPGTEQPNSRIVAHKIAKSPSKSQAAVVDSSTSNVTAAVADTTSKLKDLFAPREEVPVAAFSLLDHLDLDIALDDDLLFLDNPVSTDSVAPHEPSQNPSQVQPTPRTSHAQSLPRIVLDPKQAFFFPLPPSETTQVNKARQRDTYDLIKENGWYWRDPAVRFWNTESEEEIRKRWEACRGELTNSWKQRWREAGKLRRRKKLVDREEQM